MYLALAQVRLRRRLEREDPAKLTLKMWLFPWLSYTTIALMAGVILAMALLPSTRSQFWLSAVTLVLILLGFEIRRRRGKPVAQVPAAPADPVPDESKQDAASAAVRE